MEDIANKAHMLPAEIIKLKQQERKELMAKEAKQRENAELQMIKDEDDDKHETIQFREKKRDEAKDKRIHARY